MLRQTFVCFSCNRPIPFLEAMDCGVCYGTFHPDCGKLGPDSIFRCQADHDEAERIEAQTEERP